MPRTGKPTAISVWTRPQRPRREQPALSREQIVSEAIALLDSEGIEALSMRKLGTRLNAGATSLYTHVSNKDEIIELAVDQVYGEIEVPQPVSESHEDWLTAAKQFAENVRATLLRHPWIASVLGELGMAHLGPNMMGLTEEMLGLFESGGFDLETSEIAGKTIWAYVIGVALTEAAYLTTLARSGRAEQEWHDMIQPAAAEAVQAYPRLRKMYAMSPRGSDAITARQGFFEVGITCILDGLQAHAAR
ncbi:TetR/AcrR family transcriptional regulator [Streptomyces sp. NRRL B-1347]|uniref:TetR/AcrR family transcriptional regulator n=1 Tax=Streptomyces sp. NRRL B-1347 TaxID=1476877 RepID=UPI0004CA8F16|nr:TetR/AcrR family transcriptional regulator C-terminal domain-containing protein [Streptomyces sp. NRRL B-1347]